MGLLSLTKKCAVILLLYAVVIPFYYGSADLKHLRYRLLHSFLTLKHQLRTDVDRRTLSADYRAFEEIMLTKPLGNLDEPLDPNDLIKSLRAAFAMSTLVPPSSTCQIRNETFEHDGHRLQTYWIDDHRKPIHQFEDRFIIYLHGGGYMVGDIHSHVGFECHLSRLFNLTLLHLEYRLSPEHPLPAAVEDTIALYRSLLRQNYSSSQILFMGDSAGGGLTLLTIQSIIAEQLEVPRGAIVLSPWTDLSASGESYQRNRAKDVMFTNSDENDDSLIRLLLGANPSNWTAAHPRLSPLFGSFNGFPPLFIAVGTAEVLEDDARRVWKKAEADRVEVTFEEGEHLMHVYPLFYPYFPEARRTLNNIRRWIEQREGSDTPL